MMYGKRNDCSSHLYKISSHHPPPHYLRPTYLPSMGARLPRAYVDAVRTKSWSCFVFLLMRSQSSLSIWACLKMDLENIEHLFTYRAWWEVEYYALPHQTTLACLRMWKSNWYNASTSWGFRFDDLTAWLVVTRCELRRILAWNEASIIFLSGEPKLWWWRPVAVQLVEQSSNTVEIRRPLFVSWTRWHRPDKH